MGHYHKTRELSFLSVKCSSALFPAVRLFSKFFKLKIIYMLQLPAARPCTALNCIFHWRPVEYSTPFHWNRVAYSTEWNVHSTGIERSGMVASVLPGGWNGAISQLSGATLESGMEGRKMCGATAARCSSVQPAPVPYGVAMVPLHCHTIATPLP